VRPLIQPVETDCTPACLASKAPREGLVLLESADRSVPFARYSFVTANPFLGFRSFGSRCEMSRAGVVQEVFGNPWHILDSLMSRFEMLDECDLPFPLGGCFGFWGYDLKNFVEPKLPRKAVNDLELPDCAVGFYSSLVVWDHLLGKTWIVSTGLELDGSRSEGRAEEEAHFWGKLLEEEQEEPSPWPSPLRRQREAEVARLLTCENRSSTAVRSNISREAFLSAIRRAQEYIRLGHIYQVNLSHRLEAAGVRGAMEFYLALKQASPAPFAAYLNFNDFQMSSSSPELFLRMSGNHITTRPIKGTRPRDSDPTRDAQLTYELQTSAKEMAELVMITDLLRNDLGRVCEYGSVQVPDLVRLEKYAHVQHLVSTVEGRLRPEITHFKAFASCFPGGSITGAPKIRAMEIIDELEPLSRGAYTGALGYIGFNRESQLGIVIRSALYKEEKIYFNVGAGIVADSNPEAEYEETLAKARGFAAALQQISSAIGHGAEGKQSDHRRATREFGHNAEKQPD
jgi:para-aminobenzoate synthetase component 1